MSNHKTLAATEAVIHHDGARLVVRLAVRGGTVYIERFASLDATDPTPGPVEVSMTSFNSGKDLDAAEEWALTILRAVTMARLVREGRLWPV